MTTPTYTKAIQYDPETRDFAMYCNGELVGFASSFQKAEDTLDALVYDLLQRDAATVEAMEAEAVVEPVSELPTPAQVAAACTAIAEEYRDAAAGFEAQGQADAAKDLRAAARAAEKAAFYALEGASVARWVGEVLMVRSASEGGVVYGVRVGGCCCKAAEKLRSCWHGQLRCGHERALEGIEAGYAVAA